YSIVQGGFTGTGNLNINPLFVDQTNRDFRLQAASPAIDSGSNTLVPALDELGVRIIDRIVIRRASIDRFSALPEVLERLPVGEVLLSSDWFRAWASESPQAVMLERLQDLGIPVRNLGVIGGWSDADWTWSCTRSARPMSASNQASII
ncbi:MAG: hypothetical protein ACK58T_08315, partial [Phycisphaerae bacterium]